MSYFTRVIFMKYSKYNTTLGLNYYREILTVYCFISASKFKFRCSQFNIQVYVSISRFNIRIDNTTFQLAKIAIAIQPSSLLCKMPDDNLTWKRQSRYPRWHILSGLSSKEQFNVWQTDFSLHCRSKNFAEWHSKYTGKSSSTLPLPLIIEKPF